MARSDLWTRDQQILALRHYHRTPFGQLDQDNKAIQELAAIIGRSPGALAMKTANFASLDPTIKQKGLSGASKADELLWNEFYDNPESLAAEAEQVYAKMVKNRCQSRQHP